MTYPVSSDIYLTSHLFLFSFFFIYSNNPQHAADAIATSVSELVGPSMHPTLPKSAGPAHGFKAASPKMRNLVSKTLFPKPVGDSLKESYPYLVMSKWDRNNVQVTLVVQLVADCRIV